MLVKTGLSHTSATVGPCLWGHLHSIPSIPSITLFLLAPVLSLMGHCPPPESSLPQSRRENGGLALDERLGGPDPDDFFFQQDLNLCVKCTAPQNRKVVIQFLLCISSLVTLTAQSMIIISDTARHRLQAAREKVKLG